MSLILKIVVEELADSFVVKNCTGTYSSSNKTGFGGLNPRVEDVIESYFLISTPYTTEPIKVDVFPDFPNNSGYDYSVQPYQVLNSEGIIKSGLWKVKWVVKVSVKGVEYSYDTSHIVVFTKDIYCCVNKHTVKLDKNIATDDVQKKIVEIKNIMQATEYCIEKGMFDAANKNIEYLKLNCENFC